MISCLITAVVNNSSILLSVVFIQCIEHLFLVFLNNLCTLVCCYLHIFLPGCHRQSYTSLIANLAAINASYPTLAYLAIIIVIVYIAVVNVVTVIISIVILLLLVILSSYKRTLIIFRWNICLSVAA